MDHDPLGHPDIHLHVRITVDGPSLTIDYTGSDERQELPAWSTYGNTRGYTVAQVAAMMDPEIPKNEGFFNSIRLVVPEGCVLNPRPGSAGGRPGRTTPALTSVRSLRSPCRGVLPDRAVPQTYKTGIPTIIRGVDPRSGREFVDGSAEVYAGWCNAAKGQRCLGCRLRRPSATSGRRRRRSTSSLYPHIQWSRDYRTDSGGPGAVARRVRLPLCEGGACPGWRVYTYVVGHEVPHARGSPVAGQGGAQSGLTLRYGSDYGPWW